MSQPRLKSRCSEAGFVARAGRDEPRAAGSRYGPVAKARKQRLKIFKTPIGFHDAYVAAPSRTAALEAWGAGTDLFSAGIAEQASDDGEAAKAALERPGEVVRVARSGGKDSPSTGSGKAKKGGKAQAKPKPSRTAMEKAEAAVAALEQEQAGERDALAKEEAALVKRRRALEAKQRQALERSEAKRDAAKARYREAMAKWGG